MKKVVRLSICISTLLIPTLVKAQISGVVFRDYNANGVKDNSATFNENFVQGITVKAFSITNVQLGTTKTTNASGVYNFTAGEIPSGTKVRIEFSGLSAGDQSGFKGTGNGSNVQFISAPSSVINYAVGSPEDYWNNTANPNPDLLVAQNRRGVYNGYYGGSSSLLKINNTTSGPIAPLSAQEISIDTGQTNPANRVMLFQQTGSIFGLANQRKQQRYFASAELIRNSGFGPKGSGGIYIADKSGAEWVYSAGFTLQGVAPSNGGAALDFGSVTRVTSPDTDDNYISVNSVLTAAPIPPYTYLASDSRDNDAFAKAGTMSYGDIEADPNSDKIYMINAFQKSLIVFNASATSATLNNAVPATLAPFTSAYVLASLPGYPAPTGAGNNMRPYGVKINKGKGYIGVVSDAMATQNMADLKGYILQFDPNNIAAGFTTVITIDFSLYAFQAPYTSPQFHPWVTTWAQAGGTPTTEVRTYSQPMISSMEFNEDGSMDIGIRDRWGNQLGGYYDYIPVPGATWHTANSIRGDLLHACWNGATWNLEGTPGSCAQNIIGGPSNTNNGGQGFWYNSADREFYADRAGDGGAENGEGGLTKLIGSGIIVSTVKTPMASDADASVSCCGGVGVYWDTQGVQWNSNSSGLKTQIARTQAGVASMAKSNGMGDIEFAAGYQSLQIGNRVWEDLNYNGKQDADETTPPVPAGTVVTLRSPGLDGIYGNGDDQTWTTTTDAAGNYYFDNSNVIAADNRKPATWTAVTGILPGYDYRIEIAIPALYTVTIRDVSGNGFDNIDSDATRNGALAIISVNTNNVTHNYDIGLVTIERAILPARLVFTAVKNRNDAVLNWKVTQEENVARYVLEHSTDGINFLAINSQDKNVTNVYQYTDVHPAVSGINYYRVCIVDMDGRKTYSEVRMLKFDSKGQISIFPNPANDIVNINLTESWQGKKLSIHIINQIGQLVINKQIENSSQVEAINVSKLPSGMYTVRLINTDGIFEKRKLQVYK